MIGTGGQWSYHSTVDAEDLFSKVINEMFGGGKSSSQFGRGFKDPFQQFQSGFENFAGSRHGHAATQQVAQFE